MSTDRERDFLSRQYGGNLKWQARVAGMSNEQVIAIYRRFLREEQKPTAQDLEARKPVEDQDNEDDPPTLF